MGITHQIMSCEWITPCMDKGARARAVGVAFKRGKNERGGAELLAKRKQKRVRAATRGGAACVSNTWLSQTEESVHNPSETRRRPRHPAEQQLQSARMTSPVLVIGASRNH